MGRQPVKAVVVKTVRKIVHAEVEGKFRQPEDGIDTLRGREVRTRLRNNLGAPDQPRSRVCRGRVSYFLNGSRL
jgi:hypothetical protein